MRSLRTRVIFFILAFTTLSSCAQLIRSEVRSFGDLPIGDQGATFYMLPLQNQASSLEYRQYASKVATKLELLGYRSVDNFDDAAYVVFLDYAVDGGKTVSGAVPIWGQTGGGTTYQSGTVTTNGTYGSTNGTYNGYSYTQPTYGVIGTIPWSRTEYRRLFFLSIVDPKTSTAEQLHTLYEATVISS